MAEADWTGGFGIDALPEMKASAAGVSGMTVEGYVVKPNSVSHLV